MNDEIWLAVEADFPSGSEDERFGSDDSDFDKDYVLPSDHESEIDSEGLEQDDADEHEQVTSINYLWATFEGRSIHR